jgi:hypothetical protein
MSITNDKHRIRVSYIAFIFFAINTAQVFTGFTDVPRKSKKIQLNNFNKFFLAPPTRPERFHSREELKRYLQLVCLYQFFFYR